MLVDASPRSTAKLIQAADHAFAVGPVGSRRRPRPVLPFIAIARDNKRPIVARIKGKGVSAHRLKGVSERRTLKLAWFTLDSRPTAHRQVPRNHCLNFSFFSCLRFTYLENILIESRSQLR